MLHFEPMGLQSSLIRRSSGHTKDGYYTIGKVRKVRKTNEWCVSLNGDVLLTYPELLEVHRFVAMCRVRDFNPVRA